MSERLGYEAGEICNRDGCKGIIEERDKEPCYCSATSMPPCSACTEPVAYCEECGWDDKEEQNEKWRVESKGIDKSRKYYDSIPKRISKLMGYSRDYM